jgi:uncharacterized protein (DUF1800 family)
MDTHEAVIALRRFGLGARPGERAALAEPREALLARLGDPARYRFDEAGLPTLADAVAVLDAVKELADGVKPVDDPGQAVKERQVDHLLPELSARLRRAVTTGDGFAERLVWFWANHFTVAATKAQCAPFVGLFERQVVRAHLAGTFEDLLIASSRHPGMTTYLDQARSIGPDSKLGAARGLGLNENLGREILELHTLGVHGGYDQDDVIELARALTGWTVSLPRFARFVGDAPTGASVFVEAIHQPGARTVLGVTYPDRGPEQAVDILRALARHPATAEHVATKLVRHFVADEPPADAVAAVAKVFRDTGGDLPAVHAAVVALPGAWAPELRKRTTPTEYVVGSLRALAFEPPDWKPVIAGLGLLGQPVWRASSPAGWPDTAAEWGGSDALSKRLDVARRLAREVGSTVRPDERLADVLGPQLRPETAEAIRRAASAEQGLVLGLLSPEFQWR